jgi:iron(III) transport system ATP-binding protein
MQDTVLSCSGLVKRFGDAVAVDGFDLEVRRGELVCVLGPSGCGKTTALRLIAGLERPEAGTVRVAGRTLTGPGTWMAPERRRVGMVFQDWALFPHLDVRGNVAFGLDDEATSRVGELLELVRLEGLEHRMPHELSGGEQQRVALARAFIHRPKILFADEPTGNLDSATSEPIVEMLLRLNREAGTALVLVTHDPGLAAKARRVIKMSGGAIISEVENAV